MVTTNSLTNLNQVAEDLGVRVRTAPTPGDHWGIYDHKYRLVTIRPELGAIQYRCTLAHELGHAYYGHTGHLPRHERKADEWASKQLLTFDALADAALLTLDTRHLAAELGVLPWVIRAFAETLNEHQVLTLLEAAKSVVA